VFLVLTPLQWKQHTPPIFHTENDTRNKREDKLAAGLCLLAVAPSSQVFQAVFFFFLGRGEEIIVL
jgi:hypothetical protein